MSIKIIFGSFVSLIGCGALFLSAVFMIASPGASSRLYVGIVFLIVAVVFLIAGIRLIRSGYGLSPAVVRKKILSLARVNQGVLREEVITGNLGDNNTVINALHFFVKNNLAERVTRNGFVTYRFPDFHLKLVVRKCPYCGNDYPVRDGIEQCPGCGGDLKMQSARVNGDRDLFNLDE